MEIKQVGVLGCGLMGSGIAQVAAMAGFDVTVLEVEQKFIDKGFAGIEKSLAKFAERPNMPCGRRKMISRKTTKIAVFCNWYGNTSVDICCTMPIRRPPQKAPKLLPKPPSTTPAYMTMTKLKPT